MPVELLPRVLLALGVGFLLANLRLFYQFIRFLRLRRTALLIWPGAKPPFYRLLLVLAAVLSFLIIYKLTALKMRPVDVFGETMMMVYYGYAIPLSLKIGRGFYEDGVWAESGFIPYSRIGGMSWRDKPAPTLVMIYRFRAFARTLVVPDIYFGAARKILREKIAAHDIHFTGKALDLGAHDERDDV